MRDGLLRGRKLTFTIQNNVSGPKASKMPSRIDVSVHENDTLYDLRYAISE